MDDLDRQIIAHLIEDARCSFHTVGGRVGLSAPAVKRRVDRLRADGVITGFTAVIDQALLGHTIEAFVHIYCDGRVAPARIQAMISGIDEVQAAYTVTGEADALLHLYADDIRHFERTLERVREQPGVKQTQSTIVLSRL